MKKLVITKPCQYDHKIYTPGDVLTELKTEILFGGPWGWAQQDGNAEWQDVTESLSVVQAAAWEKIKAQRTERDKQPIEIKGKLVDFADADDREKLRTAREALETATELGQPVSEFEWTCADNSTILLGLADFKMIPLLAAIRSDANHKKSRAIKDLIYATETPAAVDAILTDPDLWGD